MENDKNAAIDIMVDLDSIMDTRLPTIYNIDSDLAARLNSTGAYYDRTMDEFEYLSSDIFTPIYRNRTKDILKLATPTKILDIISNYYNEARSSVKKVGGSGDIIVYLNIHPYDLNQDEIDMLGRGLSASLSGIVVEVVSMSNEELTAEWVSDNLAALILYNGLDWLEYQMATVNIIKHPCVEVALMVPAINNASVDKKSAIKIFEDMEKLSETIVRLNFVKTDFFCGVLR